jgi:small redox-active disulfide protein 2
MKTIQILGPGCARCNRLEQAAQKAASELGIEHRLEKITDVACFADFGVMLTPALIVDGEVKVSGRVPSHDELKKMLC